MGLYDRLKCERCGKEKVIYYMEGGKCDDVTDKLNEDARAGEYGELIMHVLESDPTFHLRANLQLYVCPDCGNYENEECLDIYGALNPNSDIFFRGWDDPPKFEYVHLCVACNQKMEKCDPVNPNPFLKIRCKECGGTMKLSPGGIWD